MSLFLRFGDRDNNEVIDFVGLDGRDARAFGNDGGRDLRCMMDNNLALEVR